MRVDVGPVSILSCVVCDEYTIVGFKVVSFVVGRVVVLSTVVIVVVDVVSDFSVAGGGGGMQGPVGINILVYRFVKLIHYNRTDIL